MSVELKTGAAPAVPYRVLARKYRPSHFGDLIGQEPMVRTLSNAFDLDRIHQAYLLSGVRGVGKTTTARIIARALNYHRAAEGDQPAVDRPTVAMDALGIHCQAIIESRHVDVVEMDAASHTGIDDIRELIEGARYRPVLARTKVYIIDEVHMLSKAAFNGLLKTLEEPPEHVKFLFATTEIDKVPVTVRSRCQRFDLRRIESPVLVAHLASICEREGVAIVPEALALIARAAEGSVRDALSLLDQAIAHGTAGGSIDEEAIRAMLGLADRARVIDLFERVMKGEIATALDGLKALYDQGADPLATMSSLADFVHLVTRLKLVPGAAADPALTGEERSRGQAFAAALSLPVLTRTWQMLLKGIADIKDAPRPIAAADMVLVRLAYAADLPTPDEALRQIASAPSLPTSNLVGGSTGGEPRPRAMAVGQSMPSSVGAAPARPAAAPAAAPRASTQPTIQSFADVVALAASHRDIALKAALERDVRLVRFEDGAIDFEPAPGAAPALAQTLSRKLADWTGMRWMVTLSPSGGAPSLRERSLATVESDKRAAAESPLVRKVLDLFPGSEIVAIHAAAVQPPELPPPPPSVADDTEDDEVIYLSESLSDDDL